MPLVYQQDINEGAKIGVWQITESEDFFSAFVLPQKNINHPFKKLQHLSARYLLTVLKNDVSINRIEIADSGKPFIEENPYHFSISHCGHYAAAIVDESRNVGVDIELPNPKIIAIKNKFTDEVEVSLFTVFHYDEIEILTIIWSIKESMFKWYGLGAVDFKKHLKITALYKKNNKLMAECILTKNCAIKLISTTSFIEGLVLTYVHELM
jgi:phosphopantetheinyl transferase